MWKYSLGTIALIIVAMKFIAWHYWHSLLQRKMPMDEVAFLTDALYMAIILLGVILFLSRWFECRSLRFWKRYLRSTTAVVAGIMTIYTVFACSSPLIYPSGSNDDWFQQVISAIPPVDKGIAIFLPLSALSFAGTFALAVALRFLPRLHMSFTVAAVIGGLCLTLILVDRNVNLEFSGGCSIERCRSCGSEQYLYHGYYHRWFHYEWEEQVEIDLHGESASHCAHDWSGPMTTCCFVIY